MRTKKDITAVLSKFIQIAWYDEGLQKYYLMFEDRKRGGIYTLMLKGQQWSIHGDGFGYCDDEETFLSEKEVVDFLWSNRTAFKRTIDHIKKQCGQNVVKCLF